MLQIILTIIAFLIGFFFSSVFDTTIAEFQEWSVVGAALIVASFEMISKSPPVLAHVLAFFDD